MKRIRFLLIALLGAVVSLSHAPAQSPPPGQFNYQGQLLTASGTNIANGNYNLNFRIYTAPTLGSPVLGPVTIPSVPVVSGFFNVVLGQQADPSNRFLVNIFAGNTTAYLEVQVDTNNPITPRQQILAAPYAFNSDRLRGYGWDSLNGQLDGARILSGTVNASQIAANTFWRNDGNAGTTVGTHFLGTTDNRPVDFRVNSSQAVRIDVNGNVGVGTTTPTAKLQINGAQEGLRIQGPVAGVANQAYVSFYDSAGTAIGYVGDGGSANNDTYVGSYLGNVSLATPAGVALTATSSGRVGIGTQNPQATFDVSVNSANYAARMENASGSTMFVGNKNPTAWTLEIQNGNPYDGANAAYFCRKNTSTAAELYGNVIIHGNLSKSGGSFKIDHPLDPANKYLSHSFVESPDMKNIYDGVAKLDEHGEATVELPEWFEALNRDFRYQLTPIGAAGPNLYIAGEIANNRFKIAGGSSGAKVSWQVTGTRQDAWASAHRIPVEEDKPLAEKGYYLTPEVHGQTEKRSVQRVWQAEASKTTAAVSTP